MSADDADARLDRWWAEFVQDYKAKANVEMGDLARLASAATPGPWFLHEMGKLFVGNGAPGSLWQIVHMSGDDLADLADEAADRARADAEFIAAANPATILRLIAENRDMSERLAQAYRDEALARDERDRLAARLAAVEALADEWDRENLRRPASDGPVTAYLHECAIELRAVLSAAPTDTTKETS
ncbi:MAG TPA: hypothetical protein VK053_18285 [Jiangellaceae bacterium]|nr:hypothetical protein [Jiangellaceae bacterium]